MRQLTITIPDDFYETFVSFFKHIPNVSIDENLTNKILVDNNILDEIPIWQQKKALENAKNTEDQYYES